MASPLPYMQFFPSDYFADTVHLKTVEHGAYLLLMITYWHRGESFKAKDAAALDERLAAVAKLSLKEWKKIKGSIAEFFIVTETEWRHRRIERDWEALREKAATYKANGKKGAQARWENPKPGHSQAMDSPLAKPCPTDGKQMAKSCHSSESRIQNTEEKKLTTTSYAPAPASDDHPGSPEARCNLGEAAKIFKIARDEFEKVWPEAPPTINHTSQILFDLAELAAREPESREAEFWESLAKRARANRFLRREIPDKRGKYFPGMTFNWFVQPDTIAKTRNGLYDERTRAGPPPKVKEPEPEPPDDDFNPISGF